MLPLMLCAAVPLTHECFCLGFAHPPSLRELSVVLPGGLTRFI
jgi:hypothetical protein